MTPTEEPRRRTIRTNGCNVYSFVIQGSRPYDPSHYQVADLSDSAERRLLIDIQSDDRSDDDDDASSGSSHSSLDSTKKNTAEFRGDGGSGGRVMHHYRRSSPDSADETISGTLSSHVRHTSALMI